MVRTKWTERSASPPFAVRWAAKRPRRPNRAVVDDDDDGLGTDKSSAPGDGGRPGKKSRTAADASVALRGAGGVGDLGGGVVPVVQEQKAQAAQMGDREPSRDQSGAASAVAGPPHALSALVAAAVATGRQPPSR